MESRPSNGIIDNEDAIYELAEIISQLEERVTALEERTGDSNDGK